MKKAYLFLILFSSFLFAQKTVYNVSDYGIKGDGVTDASAKLNSLIKEASNQIKKTGNKVTLFIPSGTYLLNTPLNIPKLLDIEGESNHTSIFSVKNRNSPAIIITNSEQDQKNNILDYNRIENLVIYGPDSATNPFAWKNFKEENTNSNGISIRGIRNRIKNCLIDGFLNAGIEVSSSYYNYITESYIRNNKIGILIKDTSTSAYVNNNEFRINSIAIYIKNNSYSNFINNNMIEANIANFMDGESSEEDGDLMKKGKGIAIENSFMNFVNNNYFEQQFTNIALKNASDNNFVDNFFAIGGEQPYKQGISHSIIKFFGDEKNNHFNKNKVLTPNNSIAKFNIVIQKKDADLSTNTLDFGPLNSEVENNLQKKYPKSKYMKLAQPQTSRK